MKEELPHARRRFIKKSLAATAGLMMPFMNRASAMEQAVSAAHTHGDTGKVILFQGDSITDGARIKNNTWDQNHQMGHGYAFAIAAQLGYRAPEKQFKFFNRGISGNKLSDLAGRSETDTIAIKPDVLSILIGVNDVDTMIQEKQDINDSSIQFEKHYGALLMDTRSKLPDCRFIMMEPFILPVGRVKDGWQEWSAAINKIQGVSKRVAQNAGAIFIPLQKAFEAAVLKAPAQYWIWDGIHPTPAGHELIAREWMNQVKL